MEKLSPPPSVFFAIVSLFVFNRIEFYVFRVWKKHKLASIGRISDSEKVAENNRIL